MFDSDTRHALLSQAISVAGLDFTFSLELGEPPGALPPLTVELSAEPLAALPDTYLIRFVAERTDGEPIRVGRFALRWHVPAVDMHGFYAGPPAPDEMIKLPYWWVKKQACANSSFPFVTLFHRSGENRAAFGLIDQLTETALDADLVEATRGYHFHWHKPRGERPMTTDPVPVRRWVETLFVSTARCPWPDVLKAYVAVVDQEWPQPKMAVPPSAYDPVFCTWTAVHHAVSQDWVLRNARLARELGFGTWLTDDGWFTDKADFANYSYAGDWEPCLPKFPDFAGHVRAVQAMGLRYLLWVAPFMVGTQSAAAQRYAHLLLPANPRLNFSNLSPQLRQTGTVVVDLLGRLMRDYGLDGLKIDFIDDIQPDGHLNGAADFATLGEGFYTIMSEAADRLRDLKPDALIEYRNSYTNLASRRYANLYRASDVPLNFTMNRWQVVMLRLLAPDRAVHLDPGLWHPGDSDEAVAVHLINLLSSVPMVSIELDRYPQSHLDLIRHWIGFYRAHRDTIMHGEFAPEIRHGHIPHIRYTGSTERIIGVYDDCALAVQAGPRPLWILNASTRPYVELLPDGFAGTYNVSAYDKFGRRLSATLLTFPRPRLDVEVGGSLKIGAG